eukprot:m51a1_g11002 hypothetical protein (198) ;mRNA; r:357899-358583
MMNPYAVQNAAWQQQQYAQMPQSFFGYAMLPAPPQPQSAQQALFGTQPQQPYYYQQPQPQPQPQPQLHQQQQFAPQQQQQPQHAPQQQQTQTSQPHQQQAAQEDPDDVIDKALAEMDKNNNRLAREIDDLAHAAEALEMAVDNQRRATTEAVKAFAVRQTRYADEDARHRLMHCILKANGQSCSTASGALEEREDWH